MIVSQAFAKYRRKRFRESLAIGRPAIIKPESLLVQIAEEMKRIDANVGSFQAALEKRPEILDPVSVNLAVNVAMPRSVDYAFLLWRRSGAVSR